MNPYQTIKEQLISIIKDAYGFNYQLIELKEGKYGYDFTLICYNLCKLCHDSPFNVASKINEILVRDKSITKSEVDKGYLKFNVDPFYLS